MKNKKSLISTSLLTLTLSTSLLAQSSISDGLFPKQWGLQNIGQEIRRSSGELTRNYVEGIPGTDINWDRLETREYDRSKEVVVAVIDSGVDIDHPELKGRIWEDPKCKEMSEEERSEFPCHGMNFLAKSDGQKKDVSDDTGHGTHVAGVIAANINGEGIAGATVKKIKIMPIKVLSKETTSFVYNKKLITDVIADGIGYAVKKKAQVINLSLGWPKVIETPRLKSAFQLAEKAGVVIVAAAGNNNKDVPTYPCTNRGIICVGAVDNTGKLAEFSNHGGKVDVLAPGESIISLFPTKLESRALRIGGYELKKGTSQASPFVAAVAATIKLIHPEANLDEIKARILASGRSTSDSNINKDKFSKFGLIDMKKSLDEKPIAFVTPDYKGLLEINFNSKKEAGFNLPIKSFVSDENNVKVTLSTESKALGLVNDTFTLNLTKGFPKNMFVQAKLVDGTKDSSAYLKVKIESEEGKVLHQSQSLLLMTSSFLGRENITQIPLSTINPGLISYFDGKRKVARMKYVFDKFNKSNGQEFYYVDKKEQTEIETVINVLSVADEKYSQVKIKLPKASQLLSIFKVDVNMDGEQDYFVYTMDANKENLHFSLRNAKGEPLFKEHSNWTFPISTFEGLPLKHEFKADFSWLKINHKKLGAILVPAITKAWNLPEEDNTDDILDQLPDSKELRVYYMNPVIKGSEVEVKVRTVIDFNFHEAVTKKFKLRPSESYSIQSPFTQTEEEELKGELKTILAVGREFQKKYYLVTFKDQKKYEISPMKVDKSYLEGNSVFPVNELTAKANPSNQATFMVLNNRVEARLSVVDHKGEKSRIERTNKSWGDPFFSYIGAFAKEKSSLYFLESRYNVYALGSDGSVDTLPVNRDSSFPGVKFAETMDHAIASHKGEFHPAVFVNSTQVFGNRLYLMVHDGESFKRPVNTSLNIPKNCIDLKPARYGSKGYQFQFLCLAKNKKLALMLIPFEY